MNKYSNGCIYMLKCKDDMVKDVYIGSTIHANVRYCVHRCRAKNDGSSQSRYDVYECIRDTGGWDNWEFIIIENYPCESKKDLLLRERYWCEIHKPTLNKRNSVIYEDSQKEYRRNYAREYSRTPQRKEYAKNHYSQPDVKKKHSEYMRVYNKQRYQTIKLRNKSARIIQRFFKQYLKNKCVKTTN